MSDIGFVVGVAACAEWLRKRGYDAADAMVSEVTASTPMPGVDVVPEAAGDALRVEMAGRFTRVEGDSK